MILNILRRSFISAILIIGIIANEAFSQDNVFETGEELKYEISYGFIKLGYMKFVLTNTKKTGKKTFYNARLEVKTYPEVPFITVNDIFETEMEFSEVEEKDEEELFSNKFYETNFRNRSITRQDCRFNYKKYMVKYSKETDGDLEIDKEIPIKEHIRYRDELSWMYEYRLNSFTNKNYNIPVFSEGEGSSVRYSYNVNKTVIKIEKTNYEIAVIKMEGTSDFTGVFGFKGEFLVLLSDDDYRVPIKAYFNSSLGNVVLELIEYKKAKWTPPPFLK
ncbi:MAG TPA: DUF3108 domain-containing protein [Ignavibacteria bacterium]|nr:DUF3108 domain-containing protein [Ignavibacteria bacterium]HQY52361.1 DUF3108 domain-containing protein [Ignavibacteria bacterium]HRA99331.1 DUF3108 domain-containing protein [Ignavibacteria bacterium]